MNFRNVLQTLFISVTLLAGLFLLVTIVSNPWNYEVKVVMSGSMEPAIRTGSVVVVRSVEDYEVGDIVTYYSKSESGETTTHRIVDVRREGGAIEYTTKGDANDENDFGLLTEERIVGKVVGTIPLVGYITKFARTPAGFLLLIIVPLGIVAVIEVLNIRKEVKKRRVGEGDAK